VWLVARRRVSSGIIDSEVKPDAFNFDKLYEEKDIQRYQGSSSEEQPAKGPEQTLLTAILALALAGTRRRSRRCHRSARAARPGMRAHPPRVVQWLIPEEPRLRRIIRFLALQECDVSSSRISIIFVSVDYRAGAYAREERQHRRRVFFAAVVATVIVSGA
jgi:MYXO-CTERM domain-containing protein